VILKYRGLCFSTNEFLLISLPKEANVTSFCDSCILTSFALRQLCIRAWLCSQTMRLLDVTMHHLSDDGQQQMALRLLENVPIESLRTVILELIFKVPETERLWLLQRQLHMVSAEETGPLSDFIVKTWGNSRVDNVARLFKSLSPSEREEFWDKARTA